MYASNRDGKKYEPSPKPHDFQLVLVHKYPAGPTPPEDREGTPPKLEQFLKAVGGDKGGFEGEVEVAVELGL